MIGFGDTFDAVIFDMDGVIVDSMPYHFEAWAKVLDDLGINFTRTELYMREGEKGSVTLDYFTKRDGIHLTDLELAENLRKKEEIFKKISKPRIFSGIEEIIDSLKFKGIPLALVTGTSYHEVKKLLTKDIFDSFHVIVSGDMVKMGKPDPEPYITASGKLKVQPERCLVVENAPYGIESAKRAGMICAAVCTSLEKAYLKKADLIVKSFEELGDFLTNINYKESDSQ